MPQWDHDPVEMYAGLVRVARFGHIEVWRGRQLRPKARASSMSDRIGEYIYEQGGQEWEKVAARTREVLEIMMPGGGYIAGASHDYILEETPVENVVAMFDAVAEFGRYPQGQNP